jgi:amidase
MLRPSLLCAAFALAFFPCISLAAEDDGSVAWLTIGQLQQRMDAGKLSSKALVQDDIVRIRRIDQAGPSLRSVLELNPDASKIATTLDAKHATSHGPLYGIPVLLKDNIDTGDRTLTTAGSLALIGAPAPQDAALVTRLRTAGAVILGKANLSEWADIRSAHASSGWTARGGQTRNPYALDRNPCGSSSGSAVAVAAGLVPVAVGTETDGSIR